MPALTKITINAKIYLIYPDYAQGLLLRNVPSLAIIPEFKAICKEVENQAGLCEGLSKIYLSSVAQNWEEEFFASLLFINTLNNIDVTDLCKAYEANKELEIKIEDLVKNKISIIQFKNIRDFLIQVLNAHEEQQAHFKFMNAQWEDSLSFSFDTTEKLSELLEKCHIAKRKYIFFASGRHGFGKQNNKFYDANNNDNLRDFSSMLEAAGQLEFITNYSVRAISMHFISFDKNNEFDNLLKKLESEVPVLSQITQKYHQGRISRMDLALYALNVIKKIDNLSSLINELDSYIQNNQIISIEELIKLAKNNINLTGFDQHSWLWLAVRYNQITKVKALVSAGADINKKAKSGSTPLYVACDNNLFEIAKYLLKKSADPNIVTEKEISPLYVACQNGFLDIVKLLVDNKADVNLESNDLTPLITACHKGYYEIAEYLLDHGAQINKKSIKHKATAIHPGTQTGDSKLVELLIARGADQNLTMDNGMLALHIACQMEYLAIVKLLATDSVINQVCNQGKTPLFYTCQYANYEIAEYLIEKKADVNICDNNEQSPILLAALSGNLALVELLFSKQANINKADKYGQTPLILAVRNLEIVKFLLNNGANIAASLNDNSEDLSGMTALHLAVYHGEQDVAEFLINTGADINKVLPNGKTLLDIAIEREHPKLAEYIEAKTKEINSKNSIANQQSVLFFAQSTSRQLEAEIQESEILAKQSLT